ncbi:MAG: 50S ribosomal protein L32 [Zetaproteobacteria bacterium]|nr:50S ribosomal protein L32 [Pseudobdellovibrionaceae bacterium]
MPVPKYRTSKSKTNMRRSHHALKTPSSSLCSNCNEVKFPHSVCESCGHYRGKQVIEPKQNLGLDQNLDVDA